MRGSTQHSEIYRWDSIIYYLPRDVILKTSVSGFTGLTANVKENSRKWASRGEVPGSGEMN